MSKFHSSISRRDFIKAVGLGSAGATVAAASVGAWSYAEGSSAYTHAGWENRQGMEYFDRTPFEVDEVPEYSWKVTGPDVGGFKSHNGIHRANMAWFYENRFKSASLAGAALMGKYYRPELSDQDCIPATWPSNGTAGLDPFWQEYYELYPMMLERDKEYKYSWLPEQAERWEAARAPRAEFDANEGYLAIIRSDVFEVPKYEEPTQHPSISDWEGVSPTRAVFNSSEDAANLIKRLAHDQGAVMARITKMNPAWVVYSHHEAPLTLTLGNPPLAQARGFEWDKPIDVPQWWQFAIVVSGTMNFDTMYADPNYGTSNGGYWWSRDVASKLAAAIKKLGYPARAHFPPLSYDVIVPPIAAEAGLGEIGRTSNVICPEFGGNFRPAVITTSLPMAIDKPVDFNLNEFCSRCKLCAEVCPTQAISYADEADFEVRGLRRFYTNHAKCRDGWTIVAGPGGCRACVSVCPWTKKYNWAHRGVREVLTHDSTGITQNLAVWAERNLYHKNMREDLLAPNFKGVYDPPEWLKTENYISGFTNTPMGVA
nr:reductive dehalogenase [uncultured bacterium]